MTRLQELADEPRTMIFYESPHRVVKALEQFIETFGADRPVSVCREISKMHEESVRGSLEEMLAHFQENEPRGEFVIIVGGCPEKNHSANSDKSESSETSDKPQKLSKYQRKQLEKENTL